MVAKIIREGLTRLGSAVSPGTKRTRSNKRGTGSRYIDKKTGKFTSEKPLVKRGAATAGAGAVGVGAAGASGKDSDKKKATTKRRTAKNETKSQAAERIRRQKEDFERKKRSRKQADDAAASVKKTRKLAEQAAKDPKAQKPAAPSKPPASSVKPPKADKMDTKTKVTKPKPTSKVKVDSPKVTKVTKRPKVTGKGGRDVVSKGPMGDRRLANVTREQLKAAGLTTGPQGLRKYLNKFKELGRRPKPSDFKKNKKFDSTRPNVGGGPGILSIKAPKGRKSGYGAFMNQGGMMKSKMSSKGGAKGGRKVPPGMKGGGSMTSKMASKGGARGGKRVPPGMMGGGMMTCPMMGGAGMGGGMMKSKMSAKGGAKGGKKMAPGYKMGGSAKKFPDLTGDGKVTQKDILKGRGVPGFSEGGGAKKSKGYAKGGKVMKSKMATKGGASKKKTTRRSKPRGVGVALRGFGKALR